MIEDWKHGNAQQDAGQLMLIAVLRVVATLAAIGLVAWGLFNGLRTGNMHVRGRNILRRDQPVWYWFSASVGFAALSVLVSLLVLFVFVAA